MRLNAWAKASHTFSGNQRKGVEESRVKSSAWELWRRGKGSSVQFGFVAEVDRGFEDTEMALTETIGWKPVARSKEMSFGTNRLRSTPPRVREAGTLFKPEQKERLVSLAL
ncbi:MAG: hypothetical protein HC774_04655 [Sphingomonadales bacterium]|nr:hypothetical protein [Sphingomonadales bacterium]